MRTSKRPTRLVVPLLISFFLLVACSAQTPGGGTSPSEAVGPAPDSGGSSTGDDSGGSTSGSNPANSGGSTSAGNPIQSLTLDLTGAIGLALDNSSKPGALVAALDTGSSNLKRVNIDNSLSDVVTSGSLTVQSFMVAANNQVYLLLSTPIEGCLLVKVDGTTNEATCVDPSLSEITWDNAFGDPIQFDSEGNIYYRGIADGLAVLRENSAGTMTDLINENISLGGFLVLDDGTVFVAGVTTPTETEWTRIISPDHSLENILAFQPDFMALFPDDNIYYGDAGNEVVGRYLTASGNFDPVPWISEVGSYFNCPVEVSNCARAQSTLRTTNGKIFATVPGFSGESILAQYYPEVVLPETVVADVTISKSILTYLLLAGLDGSADNKLVLHDTNTDTETDLLGAENIEVYHLNYLNSSSHQIVMFDGLRFSDNEYVLCQVDLTSGNTLTCSKTNTGPLTDFQLFE